MKIRVVEVQSTSDINVGPKFVQVCVNKFREGEPTIEPWHSITSGVVSAGKFHIVIKRMLRFPPFKRHHAQIDACYVLPYSFTALQISYACPLLVVINEEEGVTR